MSSRKWANTRNQGWRYFFEAMWPIQKDRIKVVMSHVERHTALMRNEVRLEHIREEHDARLRALEHFERTERSNRQQEYNIIKTDVSPTFYDDRLYQIRNQICKGTGKWLLQDDVFLKWLDVTNRSTDLLWLHGIPGAGKLKANLTMHILSNGVWFLNREDIPGWHRDRQGNVLTQDHLRISQLRSQH